MCILKFVVQSIPTIVSIVGLFLVIRTQNSTREKDRKVQFMEILMSSLDRVDSEFGRLRAKTNKGELVGRDAFAHVISALNKDHYPEYVNHSLAAISLQSIYSSVLALTEEVLDYEDLSAKEKRMLLSLISTFYHNNLYIRKAERGKQKSPAYGTFVYLPPHWLKTVENIDANLTWSGKSQSMSHW